MELHPIPLASGADKAEGVARKAVHVPVAARRAPIAEQDCYLVERFGRQRPEIPHHRRQFQVGLWLGPGAGGEQRLDDLFAEMARRPTGSV